MKTVFNPTHRQELLDRIEKLTPDTERLWGTMDVAAMLWHIRSQLHIADGSITVKQIGISPVQKLVKWLFMNKLLPIKKNLPTAPALKNRGEKDFQSEKSAFLAAFEIFYNRTEKFDWQPHPIFGKMNHDEWGRLAWQHIDHHLCQFGV